MSNRVDRLMYFFIGLMVGATGTAIGVFILTMK